MPTFCQHQGSEQYSSISRRISAVCSCRLHKLEILELQLFLELSTHDLHEDISHPRLQLATADRHGANAAVAPGSRARTRSTTATQVQGTAASRPGGTNEGGCCWRRARARNSARATGRNRTTAWGWRTNQSRSVFTAPPIPWQSRWGAAMGALGTTTPTYSAPTA